MAKLKVDTNGFALALLNKTKPADMSNEQFIKENLLLYLESKIAAQELNNLEEQHFHNMKEKEVEKIIGDILSARINA